MVTETKARPETQESKDSTFAANQLSCFFISCVGLALFTAGCLEASSELILECIVLILRGTNEIAFGHFDSFDALHHGASLAAFWLLATPAMGLQDWANVAVQVHVLHVPMACWYARCRGHCVLKGYLPRAPMVRAFKITWLASVICRFLLLARRTQNAWDLGSRPGTLVGVSFLAVLTSLDLKWSLAFLDSRRGLGYASRGEILGGVALGLGLGIGAVV